MIALLFPNMNGSDESEVSKTSSGRASVTNSGLNDAASNSHSQTLALPKKHQEELKGLAERFARMNPAGVTQTKWFKAIATEEGQLIINNFKTLRKDSNFNARWNFADEDQPTMGEKEAAKSYDAERMAEE